MIQVALIYSTFALGIINSLSRSKYIFAIFFASLWIIASIRFEQGPDYYSYAAAYEALAANPIDEFSKTLFQHEILFRLFGSALKSIGLNYQAYLSVIAAISLFFVGRTCLKYSYYPIFSAILFYSAFYFTWPYSGLRQGLALCIGTYYLIECSQNKQTLKYLLIISLLSLIHVSAIFGVVFYFSMRVKYEFKIQLLLVLTASVIAVITQQATLQILNLIPFSERILFYENSFLTTSYTDFKTIARFIIFLSTLYIYYIAKLRKYDFLVELSAGLMASFLVYISFKFSEILAAQLSLYGFVLLIIVIPNYVKLNEKLISRYIKYFLALIFAVLFFYKTYTDMTESSKQNQVNFLVIAQSSNAPSNGNFDYKNLSDHYKHRVS